MNSQQRPDESWDEGLKEVGWLFIESKRTSRPSAVFSPLDNGWDDKLFHAAIRQSCSLTGLGLEGPSIERFSIATGNITATLCTNATDKLACFKKASFETLKNAINATLSLPVAGPVYGPVVDGNISAKPRVGQLRTGRLVKTPLILRTNRDEAGYFTPEGINTEDEFHHALVSNLGLNFTQAINVLSHYRYQDAA
ncbi:hypothetical protein IWW34DRAFT_795848 [Fusarium oxysporum f. sp. albedinis]|nr:hypothetical protein IWW34DRAFT_795848 [Fusarium oxysporum f. sp. albedinis]